MTEHQSGMLFDSNIIVDYLRGKSQAVEFLTSLSERIWISAITVSELYAGVREGRERESLETLISRITVIEVTEMIAVEGGLLQREYLKSHGVGLADAVIAATAKIAGLKLVTLNRKHFPMLSDIITPY